MPDIVTMNTEIYDILATHGTTYEVSSVADNAATPYIVYSVISAIDGLSDDSYSRQYALEIDVYDRPANESKNTAVIEALITAIENDLINHIINNAGFTVDFINPVKQDGLPTSDEFMFRRHLTYTLKYRESD